MNDLISVIIPVYNVEKYIREALDSVRNQTYENFECIVIDDGSPDNCSAICDEYAELDQRFKIIHQTNGGISRARNAGLDIATGKWIVFLDSDDAFHPKFLECMHKIAVKYNADVVKCEYDEVTTLKEYNFNKLINKDEEAKVLVIDKEKLYTNSVRSTTLHAVAWNGIYSAKIFNNGINLLIFKEGIIAEDIEIYAKLMFRADKIVKYNEVLYYYRMTQNSITHNEALRIKLKHDVVNHMLANLKFLIENSASKVQIEAFAFYAAKECIYLYYEVRNMANHTYVTKECLVHIRKVYSKLYNILCERHILLKYKTGLKIFKISPKLFWLCGGGYIYKRAKRRTAEAKCEAEV